MNIFFIDFNIFVTAALLMTILYTPTHLYRFYNYVLCSMRATCDFFWCGIVPYCPIESRFQYLIPLAYKIANMFVYARTIFSFIAVSGRHRFLPSNFCHAIEKFAQRGDKLHFQYGNLCHI